MVIPDGITVKVYKIWNIDVNNFITLKDVLYVHGFTYDLISRRKLSEDIDCAITYYLNVCIIQDPVRWTLIGLGDHKDGVYYLRNTDDACTMMAKKGTRGLWHRRLGHPSDMNFSYLSKVCNFDSNNNADDVECFDACHRAKQTRLPFPLSDNKSIVPFSLIHCDLWGRYHTPSLSGAHYFLTIFDDFTHCTWVYLLRNKSETYAVFVAFCAMVGRQFSAMSRLFEVTMA